MTDDDAPAEPINEAEDNAQEIEALKLEVAALKEQTLRFAAEAENTRKESPQRFMIESNRPVLVEASLM